MDESWRMRMGMPGPTLPRRHSTEHAPGRRSLFSDSDDALDPEDFADVFGGPPRSVLWSKLSSDFTNSASSFYEEIFRPPDFGNPSVNGGRSLSAFRIPVRTSDGFYSDVFGSDDERRSRERSRPNSKAKSKSKSNSSSVLSSEELSPLRPVIGDDVALSSFASKLRPINVPYRWNSTTMMPTEENISKKQTQFMENDDYNDNYFIRSSHNFGFSRRVSSPETISLEPNSYKSIKLSVNDFDHDQHNSPSSAVSSIYEETEAKSGIDNAAANDDVHVPEAQEEEEDDDDDDDDDEVISSYVIEINSDYRDQSTVCDAVGINEAIAWAKEKFQKHSNSTSEEKQDYEQQSVETYHGGRPNSQVFSDDQIDKHGTVQSPEEEKQRKWTSEEHDKKQCTDRKDMQMEVLDENIKLWSAGKETNIRMLLSTLHYILWPTSGWYAIPLTSLVESSQVKKAYQKARLCLHPDKLQQRGATPKQKYIADKAFSILQDAWASFISQDVFF